VKRVAVPRRPREDAALSAAKDLEDHKAEKAQDLHFLSKQFDLATVSLDRSKTAAQIVQTSSAAIGAVYSGVLAVSFSVESQRLPLVGILAPLFLGTAVLLSTIYVAFISSAGKRSTATIQLDAGTPSARRQLQTYIAGVNNLVGRRLWALQSSVVALFVGLISVSVPYIDFAPTAPAGSAPALVEVDRWPTPDPSLKQSLQQIRYQAEVDLIMQNAKAAAESAVAVSDESGPSNSVQFTLLLGAAGSVLVVAVPVTITVASRRSRR